MKLRNAHLATVDHRKVTEYLLNAQHPDNAGKAQFFESLGFRVETPERLAAALRVLAQHGDVIKHAESKYGEKLIVDGMLKGEGTPERLRLVRTIWIIERGVDAPRLVTAYPGKE